MWNRAKWLKLPQTEIESKKIYHGDMTGRFAYFRCEVMLPKNVHLIADISANSRYRLWVNGKPVLSGPCKGDKHRQYYETVELTDYLISGKNVFAAQVLYCDPDTAEVQTDERASIYGVIGHSCGHRFAMDGDVVDDAGVKLTTVTTGIADWHVYLDNSFYLKSTQITEYLGAVTESIDFNRMPHLWKTKNYDASAWIQAEKASDVLPTNPLYIAGVMPRFRMREREIPLAFEHEKHFIRSFFIPTGESTGLLENGELTIPANAKLEMILDANAILNGYPCYRFRGGKDAVLQITYFEKFGGQGSDLKRTDYINGSISGLTDTIRLSGGEETYEPFWVRCFRFVRLSISTGAEPVTLMEPTFQHTGYPLKAESEITSQEPWVQQLWQMCVRTLQNCMLETYMDCPYYEQLQFAMDTRLEALYTYVLTGDTDLVRKALIDFHYGMMPEGLTPGKYPSVYLQVLSTFSLHYVMMLWEYYKQTGDAATVRLCRCDIDRILDYYEEHVGKDGLVGRLGYWEFVDWQEQWTASAGMPMALTAGPSTIINLMYAYTLDCAANLNAEFGRLGLRDAYIQRRHTILDQIEKNCWSPEAGLFREGPDYPAFSQHAQAWAVLNGIKKGEDAKALLLNAIKNPECLKCSFSTAFEWFRALEKAGLYLEMRTYLNDWIALLDLDCTTCPETPHSARSDCHAWSAMPMYEFVRTIAGIKSEGIAWSKIVIEPHLMTLSDFSGSVVTPKGTILFSYQPGSYRLTIPFGMEAEFRFENGKKQILNGGTYELSE